MSVQFYGYSFGGPAVFHFFAFMHSFQKIVSDFRGIHCKSFMGLAVNAGISIWNEQCSAFPH